MNEKFEQIFNLSKQIKQSYEEIVFAIQTQEKYEINAKTAQLKVSLDSESSLYDKLELLDIFDLYTEIPSDTNLLTDIASFNDENFIQYRILGRVRNILYTTLNNADKKHVMFYINDKGISIEQANIIDSVRKDVHILLNYLLSVETNSKDELIWARAFLAYADSSLEESFIKGLKGIDSVFLNFPLIVSFYKKDMKPYEKIKEAVALDTIKRTLSVMFEVLEKNVDKKEASILINQKVVEAGLYFLNNETSLDLNQQVHDVIDKKEESCEEIIQCFRKMKYNKKHIPVVNVRFINQ